MPMPISLEQYLINIPYITGVITIVITITTGKTGKYREMTIQGNNNGRQIIILGMIPEYNDRINS
jgi:hypothetical protein